MHMTFAVYFINKNIRKLEVIFQYDGAEIFNVSDRERRDPSFYVTRRSEALRTINKPVVFRMIGGLVSWNAER